MQVLLSIVPNKTMKMDLSEERRQTAYRKC